MSIGAIHPDDIKPIGALFTALSALPWNPQTQAALAAVGSNPGYMQIDSTGTKTRGGDETGQTKNSG
jgi:hypothetical protein